MSEANAPKKFYSTHEMHYKAADRGFNEANALRRQISQLRAEILRIRDFADEDELNEMRDELASLRRRLTDVLNDAYANTDRVEDIEREEREGARRVRAR